MAWGSDTLYFRTLHAWLPEPFFQTQGFLVFCAFVLTVYWTLPRRWNNARVMLLVVASLHFYAAWNAGLALLVLGTSLADYLLARWLEAANRGRRLILLLSIAMNLGVLAYFKYRGFFLNELHDLTTAMGLPASYDKLDLAKLLIPFGISFYTFEAISYAVDVYRRKIQAERSLPHFLLFILFFPHLVAGPIVRAGDFLRQAQRIKRWNWLRVQVGIQLCLIGVFKKFVIADRMAVFCDPVFADPAAHNTNTVWLAVLAYSLRIYADFSGYSDMALGVAHLFGYKLTVNFNMPYLASNVSDFWRRWHISLSTWLRDYVFIPLGGSRGGELATARNLMIVMGVGGLWHGAQWTYLLWGVYHGLLLVGHRLFARLVHIQHPLWTLASTAITFVAVSLGWVLFRPEWDKCLAMIERLFAIAPGATLPLHHRSLWWTVVLLFTCWLAASRWRVLWERLPAPVLGVLLAALLGVAQVMAPNADTMFIYFTF